MVHVRAYKVEDRMIVHFCDVGKRQELSCPECNWQGSINEHLKEVSQQPVAIDCQRCAYPLAILTQPVAELLDVSISL